MDAIRLKNLELPCRIGAQPQERAAPQNITATVALELDLRKAGKSDRLSDTLDYAELVKQIKAGAANRSFSLLEALAERIAQICLSHCKVSAVRVSVAKRGRAALPVTAEVEISRPAPRRRKNGN